ncbi:hypothetical protein PC120_g13484 [Phytophthora cactorum]|nr:hypothetical protein PC120_g13484 [Phytophthora cactorum]
MTEIVIAKPASVALIKAKLSPSEVASVGLGSTVLDKTDPAAVKEDLATLGKIEQITVEPSTTKTISAAVSFEVISGTKPAPQ